MVKLMFRCVANSWAEDAKGNIIWTIKFYRKSGNLSTSFKTMDHDVADQYVSKRSYPFEIQEEHDIGGLFETLGGDKPE